MSESGTIAGATWAERARHLAGALAEAGVRELRLHRPGLPFILLRTREADLPGLLLTAGAGAALTTPDGSVQVEVGATALSWRCTNPTCSALLRAASDVS